MDVNEFRKRGHEMVEYIADYLENVDDKRPVMSNVEPGYLQKLIPNSAPELPESYDEIMKDVERVIMPGVTHWQSPHFHAYFPANSSYPSMLADMLSSAINCIGFSWICSPACTELEVAMTDWLGKAMGLSEDFLSSSGKGGGCIQGTASEALLVLILAARGRAFTELGLSGNIPEQHRAQSRFVCYTSSQAHSSIEKNCIIAGIKCVALDVNDNFEVTGDVFRAVVERDIEAGFQPLFLCATFGTTSSCAFDRLDELGPVCRDYKIFFHVDGAYAGSALICPEYRCLANGLEMADSFNINPHKWLLTNFDCSVMWVKDSCTITNAFKVDPEYLKNRATDTGLVTDFYNWGIPLGRRFRSLKLWFMMRCYGISGLRNHIRKHTTLAATLEDWIIADDRFEMVANKRKLGLLCFRVKGSCDLNKRIMEAACNSGDIFFTHTILRGQFTLRFAITSPNTELEHIKKSWAVILRHTDEELTKMLLKIR